MSTGLTFKRILCFAHTMHVCVLYGFQKKKNIVSFSVYLSDFYFRSAPLRRHRFETLIKRFVIALTSPKNFCTALCKADFIRVKIRSRENV